MQPDKRSPRQRGRSVALVFVLLLVGAAVATPATAAPRMVYRGADVSDTTALVGENVTVTAVVENIGDDSGGYTLEYTRNGSQFESSRVTVPAETRRQFNETIQFDSPGTYGIRVNGDLAGVVRVERGVATVDEETPAQRTLDVRARSVPANESVTVDMPPTNRSFALEQWSVRTAGGNFDQVLTEYNNLSAASTTLPDGNQSDLVGLLAVDSNVTVSEATMRFAINDSRLDAAGLSQEEVTVFQHNGSRWEPLETTVVEQRTQSAVYEATGTSGAEYAVGRLNASVSVVDPVIRNEGTATGQRLFLDATLRNDGSVDGEYTAALVVNGETVNTTTVTVPAAGERSVTLSHEVGNSGTYEMALGDTNAGRIVITEGQVGTDAPDGDGATDEPAQSTDGATGDGGDLLPDSVPQTIFGIDTLYVGGAVGLLLGVLLTVAVMARRGGGGGGNSGGDMGGFEL